MTDHKQILRTFNAWRRDEVGDRTLEDFGITPRMIGEALDAVIKDAERYRQLRDGSGWPAVFDNSDDPEPVRGDELDAAIAKESRL